MTDRPTLPYIGWHDLAAGVAARSDGRYSERDVLDILKEAAAVIEAHTEAGTPVKLRQFIAVDRVERKARTVASPITGETHQAPARTMRRVRALGSFRTVA